MKRNRLSVWCVACVACMGWVGCASQSTAEDDLPSEQEGGGSKAKSGRGGGGNKNKEAAGGNADKNAGTGGESGGNEDKETVEAGGSGGDTPRTEEPPDVGIGGGGKQTQGGSSGGGGSPLDGGAGRNAGGAGKDAGGGGSPVTTGPTPCSFPTSWKPGSSTYTTYSFAQGTYSSGGKYQTACGYQGTNSGGDTVVNIANTKNFAAIPGKSSQDFDTKDRCGACVQIGNTVITIIDECPYDNGNQPCKTNPSGHLDLSTIAANSAGIKGDPNQRGQAAWKYVPCPVTGNVVVRLKKGNNNEIYIENTVLPVASVTCDTQEGSRTNYGAWHFDSYLDQCTMKVTDIAGRTIEVKASDVEDQNVDTGVQFPKCSD